MPGLKAVHLPRNRVVNELKESAKFGIVSVVIG
jgi:hypothetical protein